jgi:glycine cleavage system protein P-like pyridoxal-binding family
MARVIPDLWISSIRHVLDKHQTHPQVGSTCIQMACLPLLENVSNEEWKDTCIEMYELLAEVPFLFHRRLGVERFVCPSQSCSMQLYGSSEDFLCRRQIFMNLYTQYMTEQDSVVVSLPLDLQRHMVQHSGMAEISCFELIQQVLVHSIHLVPDELLTSVILVLAEFPSHNAVGSKASSW